MTDKFNKLIVDTFGRIEDDPEYNNWVATTFGKYFAGTEVEVENLPPICPICNLPDYKTGSQVIAKRRLNTAYVDDELNWLVSCLDCYNEQYEWYAELWDYYYSNCI